MGQKITWEAYQDKAPKKSAPKKKGPPQAAPVTPGRLDMRVGEITSCVPHPNSEKLFIEQVDFGKEIGQRQILSGLQGLVAKETLEGSKRVFLINLKPAKMGGEESCGMLLCSSQNGAGDGERFVEPLEVPDGVEIGAKVSVEGFEEDKADDRLNPKKKIWETLAPGFKVDESGEACWNGKLMKVDGKVITSKTV